MQTTRSIQSWTTQPPSSGTDSRLRSFVSYRLNWSWTRPSKQDQGRRLRWSSRDCLSLVLQAVKAVHRRGRIQSFSWSLQPHIPAQLTSCTTCIKIYYISTDGCSENVFRRNALRSRSPAAARLSLHAGLHRWHKALHCPAKQPPNSTHKHENLQRTVYSGHPRRRCMNWQGVTSPDGIIIIQFGPVEGRRHDTTILLIRNLLDELQREEHLDGKYMYGDPAYRCRSHLICPFPNASPNPPEARYNERMNAVRESVKRIFNRLEILWRFVGYEKKHRLRQSPIRSVFAVAALLTNWHTCM